MTSQPYGLAKPPCCGIPKWLARDASLRFLVSSKAPEPKRFRLAHFQQALPFALSPSGRKVQYIGNRLPLKPRGNTRKSQANGALRILVGLKHTRTEDIKEIFISANESQSTPGIKMVGTM